MSSKIDELLVQFDKKEGSLMDLSDAFKSLGLGKKPKKKRKTDNELKRLLKKFIKEIYQNHTETIDLINEISSYVSARDCYKKIMGRAKIMENFLDEFDWIFIASGVTNEKEIKQRKQIVVNFLSQIKK